MDVRLVTAVGVEQRPVEELETLLRRDDGLVWVDIPACNEQATRVLSQVFGFHPLAIRDCVERNHVPKVHAYPDHLFVILHAPERGEGGHVHYIELDQFIGPRYLVTVHGPLNPAVNPEVALRETHAVLERIQKGRLRPASSLELSYTIVSAMASNVGDPERFLEELFRARHGLIAVRTMAALSREIYARMATLTRSVPGDGQPLVADLVDQFDRVRGVADGQREFLQGVIEFCETRSEPHACCRRCPSAWPSRAAADGTITAGQFIDQDLPGWWGAPARQAHV